MQKIEEFLQKNGVKIAFMLVVIGAFSIILFTCIRPFNDWSGVADATLFAQYGNFIGGLIGSVFSMAGFFLLYKTLIAQQKTLKNQEIDSIVQKSAIEKERFETTFFNLLNVQRNITDNVKAYFNLVNKSIEEYTITITGREFFIFAKNELSKINNSIDSSSYLGMFSGDEETRFNIQLEIENLYNPQSSSYDHPYLAKEKEIDIRKEVQISCTNRFYKITDLIWNKIHNESNGINQAQEIYEIFFHHFRYAIGHYFRHLYHILRFVKEYKHTKIERVETDEEKSKIIDECNQYTEFVQAQMSTHELGLLYYNALCFPKSLELIQEFNLLENLAEEDLIAPIHYDKNIIRLKKQTELFG